MVLDFICPGRVYSLNLILDSICPSEVYVFFSSICVDILKFAFFFFSPGFCIVKDFPEHIRIFSAQEEETSSASRKYSPTNTSLSTRKALWYWTKCIMS